MIEHDGNFYFTKDEIIGFNINNDFSGLKTYDRFFNQTNITRAKNLDLCMRFTDNESLFSFKDKFITAKECREKYDNNDLISKIIIAMPDPKDASDMTPTKLRIQSIDGTFGYSFDTEEINVINEYESVMDEDLVLLLDDVKLKEPKEPVDHMKEIIEICDDLIKSKTRKDFDSHVKVFLDPTELKVSIDVWNPELKATTEITMKKEVKHNSVNGLADANEMLEKLFLIYEKARNV